MTGNSSSYEGTETGEERFNPRLTEPFFVTQLTNGEGVVTKMNPRLILVPMVSLEPLLDIDTKRNTNKPSVWLL